MTGNSGSAIGQRMYKNLSYHLNNIGMKQNPQIAQSFVESSDINFSIATNAGDASIELKGAGIKMGIPTHDQFSIGIFHLFRYLYS